MIYQHHQLQLAKVAYTLTQFQRFAGVSSSILIAIAGLVGVSQSAHAEINLGRTLIAQQVVDGLPPPPAIPSGLQPLPPSQPQASPVPASPPTPLPAQRYLVLINGDSPLLLEQVRKVESGAFLQQFEGRQMIQAGAFVEPGRAEQQAQNLELQGIGAQVIPVSTVPAVSSQSVSMAAPAELPPPDLVPLSTPSREVIFGQPPNFTPTSDRPADSTLVAVSSSYYVVIPGRLDDLAAISDQVVRLGEGLRVTRVIEERRSPLGPHVLVGPFVNRGAAERWNDYLRAFGMDARVYYRR